MYVHLYHIAVLKLIIEHFNIKIVHSKYFHFLDILTNSSSS